MDDLIRHIAYFIEYFIAIATQKMEEIALWSIMAYSGLHTKVSNHIKILANKYPAVKYVCAIYNTISTVVENKIHRLFANHRFEPEQSPWISAIWLNGDDDTVEEYIDFSKDPNICQEYMNNYFETGMELASQNLNMENGLMVMRYENKTRCNMVEQNKERNVFNYSTSNVKFLSIGYKHPCMTESIPIVLDRSWFLCGNELLSNTFVRRYLDYQPLSFYYDESYTITVIDDNMEIITLDDSQYILLEKDAYRIMKRDVDMISVDSIDAPVNITHTLVDTTEMDSSESSETTETDSSETTETTETDSIETLSIDENMDDNAK